MDKELKEQAKEQIETEDAVTVSELANTLDVPVKWLYFQLGNSQGFKVGEKQSDNPYSHRVTLGFKEAEIDFLKQTLGWNKISQNPTIYRTRGETEEEK